VSSYDFVLYSTRFEVVDYLMINIFSSTIKLYSFKVFASLSFDKGLIIFDISENVFLFHEVNLSTLYCTISEANIIAFTFNSSSLYWSPVLQMTTYWFVIGWFDNQSAQKSKVKQAAKDVVKSEVYFQIYSS